MDTNLINLVETVNSNTDRSAPVGEIIMYFGASAPTNFLLLQGGTIGSATSGATVRANADTVNLFTHLWDSLDNTNYPIQDSAGVATTRGASAAADFAANKRFPLLDFGGIFPRGFAHGSALVDPNGGSRVMGSYQADELRSHRHYIDSYGYGTGDYSTRITSNDNSGAFYDNSIITELSGGAETRPKNVAINFCIRYL